MNEGPCDPFMGLPRTPAYVQRAKLGYIPSTAGAAAHTTQFGVLSQKYPRGQRVARTHWSVLSVFQVVCRAVVTVACRPGPVGPPAGARPIMVRIISVEKIW